MESSSDILASKEVNQTLRHSLRSGVGVARRGGGPETHRQRATPVAPPGHGWAPTSPARVQFHVSPRAVDGGQISFSSKFNPEIRS